MKTTPWLCVWALSVGLVGAGCGSDNLQKAPPPYVPVGGLRGCLCERDLGAWVVGATVTASELADRTAVSDANGCFEFTDLPVGSYTFTIVSETYHGTRNGVVREGSVTDIGVANCSLDHGNILGRACDEASESWVAEAEVVLATAAGTLTTRTDAYGRFMLQDVPVGNYTVHVTVGSFDESYPVAVAAYQTTMIGDAGCGPVGGVHGRICAGDGYWLAGARVYVTLADGTVIENITDTNGYFTLAAVPEGPIVIEVRRGSFYNSFTVEVQGGTTVELAEPVCMPPTTRMAVVTGSYDSVEEVLQELGFPIRAHYFSRTPTIEDEAGNVDLIDGYGDFWVEEFLTDPAWLAEYDILFFNCGVDTYLWSQANATVTSAVGNLRDFVNSGKSLYTSDWASEVVRVAFPDQVDFRGSESAEGAARVGAAKNNVPGYIIDPGMLMALSRASVLLNFNLNVWVVMEAMGAQPGSLRIMATADVSIYVNPDVSDATTIQSKTPVLVQFDFGEGKVVFTSFHNESQVTGDMIDILNYLVFDL